MLREGAYADAGMGQLRASRVSRSWAALPPQQAGVAGAPLVRQLASPLCVRRSAGAAPCFARVPMLMLAWANCGLRAFLARGPPCRRSRRAWQARRSSAILHVLVSSVITLSTHTCIS
jgi:hypothetical protein